MFSVSIKRIAISTIVFGLIGCAGNVKQADIADRQYLTTQPAKKISISLNDDATRKISDNLKFNQNILLDHVKRALIAKNLLDESKPEANTSIEILVKDFRVRSNFSAIMFGFMAGNDNIVGDVILKDQTGKELNKFEVSASYALGGIGGGQDDARMSWLYEKFAELAVAQLTGEKK